MLLACRIEHKRLNQPGIWVSILILFLPKSINSRNRQPLSKEPMNLRSEDLIISGSLAQDFCSYSRRRNRRIARYATVSTTWKTDKKTSQDADIIKSSLLSKGWLVERYLLLQSNTLMFVFGIITVQLLAKSIYIFI